MFATRFALLCLLCLVGCHDELVLISDGGAGDGLKCPGSPDLASPGAKCAAAKGLTGDNLLCVDFASLPDQTLTTPLPQSLARWDFTSMGGNCWEIKDSKLQVKDFGNFMSACAFLMPAVSSVDYDKYQIFTLSVVHTVDLNKQQLKQSAAIYLGLVSDIQQLWLGTGTNPRQTTVISVTKSALPNGGSGIYRALFQLVANVTAGTGYQGWQIESIALNGVQ